MNQGSKAVFTAKDVPGELRVGLIHKDWPVFIPEGGLTSYLGDVLAIVVARDRETARRAAALVDVDYRVLRPITDPLAAIEDAEIAVWGTKDNVLSRSKYRRGDVEAALASSAYRVHEVFQTQRVDHAFLEPESTLAVPLPDGRLKLYSGDRGSGTIATRLRLCSVWLTIESKRSWCRTAAPSAGKKTCPTRRRPRSRRFSCEDP